MSIELGELARNDEADWNAYVDAAPAATFFHRVEWKRVMEDSYGFAGRYLLAKRAGAICGILPLGHVRRFPFAPALISSPFTVYGGAVADDDDIVQELEDAAATLARSLDVKYLELRNIDRLRRDWPTNTRMVTFRKQISDNQDAIMRSIPGTRRNKIRKAMKCGFTIDTGQDLTLFLPVFSRSVRDLGTPIFARRYFQILAKTFGKECRIKTLTSDGSVRVSAMYFYFKDEVLSYYTGGVPEARRDAAHSLLYWDMMREAAEFGCRVFDFGRSALGTGSYEFKRFWGVDPTPLNYQYYLANAKTVPNLTPTNPKYHTAIKVWRNLPLPVANALGPMVSRAIV